MQSLTAADSGSTTVLVIDQFEEALSLCEDPVERAEFMDAVVQRAEAALVVIALRADRLADVAAHHASARLVERGLHLLGTMSPADLRWAIEEPARQVGLTIQPGLVELLLRDIEDEPGALPLLSHALMETWKRREGNTVLLGLSGHRCDRGSVAQSAERVYAGIAPTHSSALRPAAPDPAHRRRRGAGPRDRIRRTGPGRGRRPGATHRPNQCPGRTWSWNPELTHGHQRAGFLRGTTTVEYERPPVSTPVSTTPLAHASYRTHSRPDSPGLNTLATQRNWRTRVDHRAGAHPCGILRSPRHGRRENTPATIRYATGRESASRIRDARKPQLISSSSSMTHRHMLTHDSRCVSATSACACCAVPASRTIAICRDPCGNDGGGGVRTGCAAGSSAHTTLPPVCGRVTP